MMSEEPKVVKFYPADAAKSADSVLEQARGQYSEVLLIGWNKDDAFDPRATLGLTNRDCLWLTELFKFKLLSGDFMPDE